MNNRVTHRTSGATGFGLATISAAGTVLDTWFIKLQLDESADATATSVLSLADSERYLGTDAVQLLGRDDLRDVSVIGVKTSIASLSTPPCDVHDVFLRLHLLSHRLIKPNEANLDGMFGILNSVAWTSIGPCSPDSIESIRIAARIRGRFIDVTSVDKIPKMTDYVVPSGARVANADRVRLGAYLGAGTTVMHEGFCNFNAGTLGASMVEGRISAGVVVGVHSDVGGGASIMGTLSGGGRETISVGERCLLGANSGIGISLGDNCVVEAGCYVTAGTRVTLADGKVEKASSLSGKSNLLFRRNSETGRVEVLFKTSSWGTLNAVLHQNSRSSTSGSAPD